MLYTHVEKVTTGSALSEVIGVGVSNAWHLRRTLAKRFGDARTIDLKERERLYDLGMPPTDAGGNPTGPAFEEKTDMPEKLHELETERNALYQICH